jgi:type I restriction enzyme S subunit
MNRNRILKNLNSILIYFVIFLSYTLSIKKPVHQIFQFRLPLRCEQKRIADILSAYDDLIENNRRRMALLEEAARQLYRDWFVRLRFPGHEHTRTTNGVPEGWARMPLGDRVTLNYGKALKADHRVDGPFPVYGSSGIVGTHEKALVRGPGIIVGRKGNVGSVYWCAKDFYPIDTVYFIVGENSCLWLYYALQHMHFISTDVAVPELNRDFAYSRQLIVPADRILHGFLEAVVPMHEQHDKLEEITEKLRAARDLLLPRLMSGEIAV